MDDVSQSNPSATWSRNLDASPTDAARPIRVLVAEDSVVMRNVLRNVLTGQRSQAHLGLPLIEICGMAADGVQCVEAVRNLKPDLLLLDIEMPRLGGLGVLDQLRSIAPELPVIICSTLTEPGAAAALEALARGASDYVTKPAHAACLADSIAALSLQLLPRISALRFKRRSDSTRNAVAGSTLHPRARAAKQVIAEPMAGSEHRSGLATPLAAHPTAARLRGLHATVEPRRLETQTRESNAPVGIVVIGVSTGGPTALERILPMLPSDFRAPIVVVQHMPGVFTRVLSQRLRKRCAMHVDEAAEGAELAPGVIWIAKGDWHVRVVPMHGKPGAERMGATGTPERGPRAKLALQQEPPEHGCRPAVDFLFRSAAHVFGEGVLGLVMTGMGSDGLEGSRAIHQAGGAVLAQDQATSAIWGMPRRVAEAGLASKVLPLEDIAEELVRRVLRSSDSAKPQPQEVAHGMLAR